MKQGCSVVPFKDQALAATTGGLFAITTDENHDFKEILKGCFCDVCTFNNAIFALTCDNSNIVKVLDYCPKSKTFASVCQFEINNNNPNFRNTIQATCDHVFVISRHNHNIQKYTWDGQLLQTYGKHGTGPAGELNSPHLSGFDQQENCLIVDSHNHRMVVLKSDGSFHRLSITGLDKLPTCARIHQGLLYVYVWHPQTMQVFELT